MSIASFLEAVYALAEHIIGERLSGQAKSLIRNYFEDAGNVQLSERAMYAVQKYTQAELPTLDSVLRKPRSSDLGPAETLIRRIHDESVELREKYNQ